MAKFEHRKYPAVVFQDHNGIWAQFTPERRESGDDTITVGVFETHDEAVIKRLRNASDPHLYEVDSGDAA